MQSAVFNKLTNRSAPPMPRRPNDWRSLRTSSVPNSPAVPTGFINLTKVSDDGSSISSPPSDLDTRTVSSHQSSFRPSDMINQGVGPQMGGPTPISCLTDDQLLAAHRIRPGRSRSLDSNMDPSTIRRILMNREFAKRSRDKKRRYVYHLEKKQKELEIQIFLLRHQVEQLLGHNQELMRGNLKLCQDLAKISTDNEIKAGETERIVEGLKEEQEQSRFQEMNGWACGLETMGQSPNFAEFGGPSQMGVQNGEASRLPEACVEEEARVKKSGDEGYSVMDEFLADIAGVDEGRDLYPFPGNE